MEIKDAQSLLTNIFLQSKKKDDESSYETTSDYVSSDGKKIKSSKKMSSLKIIKKIEIIDTNNKALEKVFKDDSIKRITKEENKRIIINKRSILLIKGRR
jgi:hypothetical protein